MCASYIGKELIISPQNDKSSSTSSLSKNGLIHEQKNSKDNTIYENTIYKNKKYYIEPSSEMKDETDCIESVSNNFCEIIDE